MPETIIGRGNQFTIGIIKLQSWIQRPRSGVGLFNYDTLASLTIEYKGIRICSRKYCSTFCLTGGDTTTVRVLWRSCHTRRQHKRQPIFSRGQTAAICHDCVNSFLFQLVVLYAHKTVMPEAIIGPGNQFTIGIIKLQSWIQRPRNGVGHFNHDTLVSLTIECKGVRISSRKYCSTFCLTGGDTTTVRVLWRACNVRR